jgi:hypothetical protein
MPMKNLHQIFTSLLPWNASKKEPRIRPKHWILGLSLFAALLSVGCPNQDPLQAFNDPNNPIDPAPAPVPEPVTALLFGAALLVGGGILRRRRNKKQ